MSKRIHIAKVPEEVFLRVYNGWVVFLDNDEVLKIQLA
jgi:hypothetical protein